MSLASLESSLEGDVSSIFSGSSSGQSTSPSVANPPPNPSDLTPMGLPSDTSNYIPAGFSGTENALPPSPSGITSITESIWNSVKQDSIGAIDWTENKVSSAGTVVKSGLESAVAKAESVAGEAVTKVESVLKTEYVYILVGLVVIGGVLYFIGKGGLVGQSAQFVKI